MSAVLFALADPIGFAWASRHRGLLLKAQTLLLTAATVILGVALSGDIESPTFVRALPWGTFTDHSSLTPYSGYLTGNFTRETGGTDPGGAWFEAMLERQPDNGSFYNATGLLLPVPNFEDQPPLSVFPNYESLFDDMREAAAALDEITFETFEASDAEERAENETLFELYLADANVTSSYERWLATDVTPYGYKSGREYIFSLLWRLLPPYYGYIKEFIYDYLREYAGAYKYNLVMICPALTDEPCDTWPEHTRKLAALVDNAVAGSRQRLAGLGLEGVEIPKEEVERWLRVSAEILDGCTTSIDECAAMTIVAFITCEALAQRTRTHLISAVLKCDSSDQTPPMPPAQRSYATFFTSAEDGLE